MFSKVLTLVFKHADRIRDWVERGQDGKVKERLLKDKKVWLETCVSMDVLEDSSEAIRHYLVHGLSRSKKRSNLDYIGGRYLKLYGVLQAIVLNQNAIQNLHVHLNGSKAVISKDSPWRKIRRLRACIAGHPFDPEEEGPTFLSRIEIGNRGFRFHYYDKRGKFINQLIVLDEMIGAYLCQAEEILKITASA